MYNKNYFENTMHYLWKSTAAAAGLYSFDTIILSHTYFFSDSVFVLTKFLLNLSKDDTNVQRVSLLLPHITKSLYFLSENN